MYLQWLQDGAAADAVHAGEGMMRRFVGRLAGAALAATVIGAVVAGPKAAQIFQPGNHGTTFGGNPLAMRAGVETLRIMEEDNLLRNAAVVGEALRQALRDALAGERGLKEIRGAGLMIGVELDRPCGVLLGRAAEAGLLISVTADSVIRIVPPLVMTLAEAQEVVARLVPLIKAFLAEPQA